MTRSVTPQPPLRVPVKKRVPKKEGPNCFWPWPLGILVQWPEHQGTGGLQLLFSPLGMWHSWACLRYS